MELGEVELGGVEVKLGTCESGVESDDGETSRVREGVRGLRGVDGVDEDFEGSENYVT